MTELDPKKSLIRILAETAYHVKHPKTAEGIDGRIVAIADKASTVAEQFRTIQTNLYAFIHDKNIKTITITSAQTGEGKTLTACNLAATLSFDHEKKVLLVDADLRKPDVHTFFNLGREPGFTDLVSGKALSLTLLRKPAVEDLFILTAGSAHTNPPELLRLPKTRDVIEELKAKFDYIIFDSSPVLPVSDSRVLGAMCDAVMLVVKADVTPKKVVEEAFTLLDHAHIRPAASILTNYQVPLYDLAKHRPYYQS